jgi:hypothetical protein
LTFAPGVLFSLSRNKQSFFTHRRLKGFAGINAGPHEIARPALAVSEHFSGPVTRAKSSLNTAAKGWKQLPTVSLQTASFIDGRDTTGQLEQLQKKYEQHTSTLPNLLQAGAQESTRLYGHLGNYNAFIVSLTNLS